MEDSIGDRVLKRITHIKLNFVDGCIPSYFSILNSPERLFMINKSNELTSVLCDIQYDRLEENEDIKKRSMEAQDNKKNQY